MYRKWQHFGSIWPKVVDFDVRESLARKLIRENNDNQHPMYFCCSENTCKVGLKNMSEFLFPLREVKNHMGANVNKKEGTEIRFNTQTKL